MPSAALMQSIAAPWTRAQLNEARTQCGTSAERAAWARAWLATHREAWEYACFAKQTRYGNAALVRRLLTDRFDSIPPARPGRAPWRYCAEFYRGSGKTTKMRLGPVLGRALHGEEAGALLCSRTADMATPHSRALQELFPERGSKGASDWTRTPFGSLYPGLCWDGSVERWRVLVPHLPGLNDEPSQMAIYARGIGGALRGFLEGFDRLTLAVFDDVETADSARSDAERDKVWRAITEEAAGISFEDIGLASIMLCNALWPDDAGERAERDPGWQHDRVAIWTHDPDETGLVRELEALWHTTPGSVETRDATVRAHPRAAEVEQLTQMTDPDRTVLWALCLRWSEGRRPFDRMRLCKRSSHGERTFDASKIQHCKLGPQVTRADGSTVPLSALSISIWLDPRFSKNEHKNDFAAVVAVGKDSTGLLYTLDADLKRDRGTASRIRLWSMLDRLLALGADPKKIRLAYETNAGAEGTYEEPFDADIEQRRTGRWGKRPDEANGAPLVALHVRGVYSPSTRIKLDEIEAMEDPLHAGRWQVAEHLIGSEMWAQLLAVPHGQHDDGPDAMRHAGDEVSIPSSETMATNIEAIMRTIGRQRL